MNRFWLQLMGCLTFVLSISVVLVSVIGRGMLFDGEIRYIVESVGTYTPYALDMVRHVGYQMRQPYAASLADWSRNGQYLALRMENGETHLLTVESGALYPINNPVSIPQWSQDYAQITFISQSGELYWGSGDGSSITRFTGDGNSTYREPVFSPDGTHIAYLSADDLYVVNIVDGSFMRLTNTPRTVKSQPVWSPDGTRIAYLFGRSQFNLSVIDLTGQEQATFAMGSTIYMPVWSSDGASISFYMQLGTATLFVADINSETTRYLSTMYSGRLIKLSSGSLDGQETLHILAMPEDATQDYLYEDDVDLISGALLHRQRVPLLNFRLLVIEGGAVGYGTNQLCIWLRATEDEMYCIEVATGEVTAARWLS